jgi:hypothetical protein
VSEEAEESIIAAAYRVGEIVYSTPRPGRHRQALDAAIALGVDPNVGDQGFVTSTGRFVTRWQAARIAFIAGQTTRAPRLSTELYSEDVW